MTDDPSLPSRVRQILEAAPRNALPMTYQRLAEALGLQSPRTIQRVAKALEALMREDAEHDRPFIAALVVSRRGEGLPAPGFFNLAVELGRFPADSARHAEVWRGGRSLNGWWRDINFRIRCGGLMSRIDQ